MAGYIGTKAVNLSTTAATVGGDADIGGDLTVDTSTLHVDSANNRVGIGTSSPAYKLDVASAVIRFGDSTDAFAQYKSSAGNWHVGANSSNAFAFYSGTYGSGIERMRIDSAGRVTKPNQPYFAAEINGNGNYVTTAAGTALPFNAFHHNIGSHFNNSTYRFTAPVTGKYLMAVGVIHNQGNPIGRIMFYLNGNADGGNMKWGINGSQTSGGGSHTATAIIYMSANDYVDVRSQSGNIVNYQSGHSSWTGMLIG